MKVQKMFTLIELLIVIAIIAILSFHGEKKNQEMTRAPPAGALAHVTWRRHLAARWWASPPGPPEKIRK